MITAARLEAENENGRELTPKQWRLDLDAFPGGGSPYTWLVATPFGALEGNRLFHLSVGAGRIGLLDPLISVDSVTYKTGDGTVVPLTENVDYIVDAGKHPGIICPAYQKTWPSGPLWPSGAVQITFTAGFTPSTVPATIKQGCLLLVSQWYEGRIPYEAIRFVAELPFSVSSLFRNGKLWNF